MYPVLFFAGPKILEWQPKARKTFAAAGIKFYFLIWNSRLAAMNSKWRISLEKKNFRNISRFRGFLPLARHDNICIHCTLIKINNLRKKDTYENLKQVIYEWRDNLSGNNSGIYVMIN